MNNWLRSAAIIGTFSFLAVSTQAAVFSSNFAGGPPEINPPSFRNETTTLGTNPVANPNGLFSNDAWKVVQKNVDYIGSSMPSWVAPPSGGNLVDLNGFTCSVGSGNCANGSSLGEINSPVITTTAGHIYKLTFYLSGNPDYLTSTYGLTPTQQALIAGNQRVYAGFTNTSNTITYNASNFLFTPVNTPHANGDNLEWFAESLSFLATDTSMKVFFFSNPGTTIGFTYDLQSWGAMVANVVVTDEGVPGVPEPATFGLFGAGLIALAALRRRK